MNTLNWEDPACSPYIWGGCTLPTSSDTQHGQGHVGAARGGEEWIDGLVGPRVCLKRRKGYLPRVSCA